MVWFKVDDRFHGSEPVKKIPREQRAAAVGLWTLAGTWSAQFLKDGFVPGHMVEDLGGSFPLAQTLVDVGLWRARRDGFQFVDWDKWQPTRESVEGKREAEARRAAAYRARRAGKSGDDHEGVTRDESVSHAVVRSSRPDPTRPDHKSPSGSPSPPVGGGSAAFAEFYMAYPRKVGKDAARRSYERVVRKIGPDVLLAAARRYSADPNLPEKQFIPHPATWLNQGRWEDEPLPPRAGGTPPPDSWNGLRELPVDE
jgi:hypothetical protein